MENTWLKLGMHAKCFYVSMSEIVHKDPIEWCRAVLEAEIIDWNSFGFKGKIDKVKVTLIYLFTILFVEGLIYIIA